MVCKALEKYYVRISETLNILHDDANQNGDTQAEAKNISAKLCNWKQSFFV
jgi:hypothetical protein